MRNRTVRYPTLFDRTLFAGLLTGALCVTLMNVSAKAATTEDFQVRTTSEYVALCSANPGQPNYVAAIHFCQGFASGAYQYYVGLAARSPNDRFVCLPDPPPSRDTALAAFVNWVNANPSSANDPPVDSIFHFLAETYPCAQSATH
jgi:hypothetical protein